MTARFVSGFSAPLRGFRFIQKNKFVWPFLLAPMFLTLLFSIGFFLFMTNEFPRMMAWMGFTQLAPILYYLLWAFMVVGFLLLGGIIGIFVGRLTTFPLYAIAAEKILRRQGAFAWGLDQGSWMRKWSTAMVSSVGKTVLLLIVAVALFIFAFLPILDVLIAFMASYLLALDCFDTPLELLEPNFKRRLQIWKQMTPELLGMSCVLALSLTIPGLSFIIIPSTIVGNCLLLSRPTGQDGGLHVSRTHS